MSYIDEDFLAHHGILGMKWGVRRYQNKDGTLTELGRRRAGRLTERYSKKYDPLNTEHVKQYEYRHAYRDPKAKKAMAVLRTNEQKKRKIARTAAKVGIGALTVGSLLGIGAAKRKDLFVKGTGKLVSKAYQLAGKTRTVDQWMRGSQRRETLARYLPLMEQAILGTAFASVPKALERGIEKNSRKKEAYIREYANDNNKTKKQQKREYVPLNDALIQFRKLDILDEISTMPEYLNDEEGFKREFERRVKNDEELKRLQKGK